MTIDPEILTEFLAESRDNLDRLEQELVVLEREPRSASTLASVFRTIHTIKGTAGFLGLERLQEITHAGEHLLDRLRDEELTFSPDMATALLALVDAVRELLEMVECSHSESDLAYPALLATLAALQEPATEPVVAAPTAAPTAAQADELGSPIADLGARRRTGHTTPPPRRTGTTAPPPRRTGATAPPVLTSVPAPAERSDADGDVRAADQTVRVSVALLDRLMNLAGELVLARNQVNQFAETSPDAAFVATCQRLGSITSELQESVMKTRMQPIGSAWSKLPRVVRDLAATCGKRVRIEMEGEDTELDRSLLDAIRDPITHMLRNAIDHGIEMPAARQANGKPVEGVIRLRAYHDSGLVTIELADDGGGICPDKVRARAIQRGLLTADAAARLGDREAVDLVFAPGFSTVDQVTSLSGRGVGMDVVKTAIERAGGRVELRSVPGAGTTVRIKIPLTLAIIPVLMVTTGGESYAIPQGSLLELVRVHRHRDIERVQGALVYRLRGRLLPVIDLAQQLGATAAAGERANLAVLQVEGRQFGVLVDAVDDTEEIVVKPLHKQLKRLAMLTGATILGDGRVALILDVRGLARAANVLGDTPGALATEAPVVAQPDPRETLLLVRLGDSGHYALPLSWVARIEDIAESSVEWAGGEAVVQYRGDILPLVRLGDLLGVAGAVATGRLQILVYQTSDRTMGLVVDDILDVVEDKVVLSAAGRRFGVRGTAVVAGRVTELLDLPTLVGEPAALTAVADGSRRGGVAA